MQRTKRVQENMRIGEVVGRRREIVKYELQETDQSAGSSNVIAIILLSKTNHGDLQIELRLRVQDLTARGLDHEKPGITELIDIRLR